jgi:glutaredoxin/glutathione-dependent peroxiredoxin
MITVGTAVPAAEFKTLGSSGVETVSSSALFQGRRVMILGVVGAFTPVCTAKHLPEFMPYQKEVTQAGLVDEVVCITVADPFVLKAWAQSLGLDGGIRLLTDTNAAFAIATGLDVDLSSIGLGKRSTRYVMVVDNGVVDLLTVEIKPGDFERTRADAIRLLLGKGQECQV